MGDLGIGRNRTSEMVSGRNGNGGMGIGLIKNGWKGSWAKWEWARWEWASWEMGETGMVKWELGDVGMVNWELGEMEMVKWVMGGVGFRRNRNGRFGNCAKWDW